MTWPDGSFSPGASRTSDPAWTGADLLQALFRQPQTHRDPSHQRARICRVERHCREAGTTRAYHRHVGAPVAAKGVPSSEGYCVRQNHGRLCLDFCPTQYPYWALPPQAGTATRRDGRFGGHTRSTRHRSVKITGIGKRPRSPVTERPCNGSNAGFRPSRATRTRRASRTLAAC